MAQKSRSLNLKSLRLLERSYIKMQNYFYLNKIWSAIALHFLAPYRMWLRGRRRCRRRWRNSNRSSAVYHLRRHQIRHLESFIIRRRQPNRRRDRRQRTVFWLLKVDQKLAPYGALLLAEELMKLTMNGQSLWSLCLITFARLVNWAELYARDGKKNHEQLYGGGHVSRGKSAGGHPLPAQFFL